MRQRRIPDLAAYSGQLFLRMMSTKSSRTNDGSKCSSTSAFTVPNVASGRCFMPSVKACRIRMFEIGPRMRGGHGRQRLGREIVTADAQYVGLDTGGDQSDFRL